MAVATEHSAANDFLSRNVPLRAPPDDHVPPARPFQFEASAFQHVKDPRGVRPAVFPETGGPGDGFAVGLVGKPPRLGICRLVLGLFKGNGETTPTREAELVGVSAFVVRI